MRSTQIIFALVTVFLTQSVMAQGQGNGPPPPPGDVNVANTPDVVVANDPLSPIPIVISTMDFDSFSSHMQLNGFMAPSSNAGTSFDHLRYTIYGGSLSIASQSGGKCKFHYLIEKLVDSEVVSTRILFGVAAFDGAANSNSITYPKPIVLEPDKTLNESFRIELRGAAFDNGPFCALTGSLIAEVELL